MSKYEIKDLWEKFYGEKLEAQDYTGRTMKKTALSTPDNPYHPTIDHIRPLSKGGLDIIENIVVCHRATNKEKADTFPHWTANGIKYKALRVKGKRGAYRIVEDN